VEVVSWGPISVAVAARKDDAPAADQAAVTNVAAVTPFLVAVD
jgi:hypothetical protein